MRAALYITSRDTPGDEPKDFGDQVALYEVNEGSTEEFGLQTTVSHLEWIIANKLTGKLWTIRVYELPESDDPEKTARLLRAGANRPAFEHVYRPYDWD